MSEMKPILIDSFRNRAELMNDVVYAVDLPETGWADRELQGRDRYRYIARNVIDRVYAAGFDLDISLESWLLDIQTRIGNSAVFSFGNGPQINPRTLDMTSEEYALANRLTNAKATGYLRVARGEKTWEEVNAHIAQIRAEIKELSDDKRSYG